MKKKFFRHKKKEIKEKKHHKDGEDNKNKIHLGLFSSNRYGGKLSPCHRKDKFKGIHLDLDQSKGMKDDDVIAYKINSNSEFVLIKNLGSITNSKIFSQMGIYAHNLEHKFSNEALEIANKGKIPELENRTDFRTVPLVTIDGADAKDFDDAVYAESDNDERNIGGWRAIVAIADVSYYVKPNDYLDEEARQRGNSVYFVDKVVPMLPEKLSNDLCSLKPNEDRACLAVEMIISKDGKLKSFKFKRGIMRSHARLTYEQVENAIKGKTDKVTEEILHKVITPLYGCYKSLKKARTNRGTINVDSVENNFKLNDDGSIKSINPKKRLESHQIIEELMITANVAAAKTLKAKDWPTAYRVHDQPDRIKLQNLQKLAKNLKVNSHNFSATNVINVINEILNNATDKPYFRLFNELVLRSQAQARYSPYNTGHFGLNLSYYCHFTSPIRRYADLIVHRALISCLNFEDSKFKYQTEDLEEICGHISRTERNAMEAEREVQDRFMADYLKNYLGEIFDGTIIGVGIPGIFVELDNVGAQGFIPRHDLHGDFFVLNENEYSYYGKRTNKAYRLGDKIKVQVSNADPITCSIGFAIIKTKKENDHTKFKKTKYKKHKD